MYSKVYIEITNRCNRACTFCPGTKRAPKFLTMEEFCEITEKLQGITDYLYFHVMGEPLVHPLLPEFIRHANEQGFKVILTTNGTLLSKRGKELTEAGVYKVNISLHSFEEGSKEDQRAYIRECLQFADHASRAGVLIILRLWNEGYDEGKNEETVDLLKEAFPETWVPDARGARIRPKLHLEYGTRFVWPDKERPELGKEVFCYGLKDHFAILSNGSVIPCCLDREGVITLGNIFTDPLEEILSSERAKRLVEGFQRRSATEELCRKCGYARRFQ